MTFGTLIHRHPMRSAAAAMLDAERALDEMQRQFSTYPRARFGATRSNAPRIDARETESEFVVTAELPGVEGSEISVAVEEGILTLKREVEAVTENRGEGNDEPETERQTLFERRIRFNGEIDEESVRAVYRNGLLTVTVPKQAPAAPEVRTIPVEVA